MSPMYAGLKLLLVFVGGVLFVFGLSGYLYVRWKLKPRWEEIEEIYYEFEESHPALRRYHQGLQITMSILVLSMVLLLLAAVF